MKRSNAQRRRIYCVLTPIAVAVFLLPHAEAGDARNSKKETRSAAIVVLNQRGERVTSGAPSTSAQIFDVAVGPSFQLIFSPDVVDIHVGDTVRWTWGSDGHTVTSGENCAANSAYCSPTDTDCSTAVVSSTGSVYQHTFAAAGTYTYYCAVHCFRGMVGTVNVTAPFQLTTAVSSKIHGAAGTFGIPLPLSGEPGVECRSTGGNYTLGFTFSNDVTAGSASVTAGIGSVSGSPSFAGNQMSVNLTGVSDLQKITVTLSGVMDTSAQVLPDTMVSMNMLIGDTSGNKTVNGTDVSQTKIQSGHAVTSSNFREDVSSNGTINGTDVSSVKLKSGNGVP
jgi:plastocyanin